MLSTLDQFDYHQRLAELSGTALVMFTAPACGSCRHLRSVLEAVAEDRPDWQLFEVDVQRDQALAYEFELFHLPTIFVYSPRGFHGELEAEARPTAIVVATQAAVAGPAQDAP
jgi:thiol-disulfide isomerase/thioredoxin